MTINRIARRGIIVATVLLFAAGCATHEGAVTQADLDALRDEIALLRADSKAASDSAAESAAAAKAAADKADQIYMQSLRK